MNQYARAPRAAACSRSRTPQDGCDRLRAEPRLELSGVARRRNSIELVSFVPAHWWPQDSPLYLLTPHGAIMMAWGLQQSTLGVTFSHCPSSHSEISPFDPATTQFASGLGAKHRRLLGVFESSLPSRFE